MPNTYTQLYYHIIFATENRERIISKDNMQSICEYITGISRNMKATVIRANGYQDHIHLLAGLPPTLALSEYVKTIKQYSSKNVNEHNKVSGRFGWQSGFAAFTVSHSQLGSVIDYINHQEEHHRSKGFIEEYKQILEKNDIAYEDAYIFK